MFTLSKCAIVATPSQLGGSNSSTSWQGSLKRKLATLQTIWRVT